jgi:hypothetical protein
MADSIFLTVQCNFIEHRTDDKNTEKVLGQFWTQITVCNINNKKNIAVFISKNTKNYYKYADVQS